MAGSKNSGGLQGRPQELFSNDWQVRFNTISFVLPHHPSATSVKAGSSWKSEADLYFGVLLYVIEGSCSFQTQSKKGFPRGSSDHCQK